MIKYFGMKKKEWNGAKKIVVEMHFMDNQI